jgi:RHS repeat-associated protein
MDLVAGGYRDGVNGKAYFPVTDAQGNVRGYASDEGLVSAYDYYAYGGVEDIVVNEADDKKRWQGKEYDGEHGKYYFGARYFDPFFGMWLSPDPAHQFANPYTYGGDPLNYVDPNGESVVAAMVVGAVIGAYMGGRQANNGRWNPADWNYNKKTFGYVVGGAVVGGVSGGAAAYVGAGATGASGLWAAGQGGWIAAYSGPIAAVAGGATSGAVSGAITGSGMYGVSVLAGDRKFNGMDMLTETAVGAGSGALAGGIVSGISYGLSDAYQWKTHKTVMEYGIKNERYLETARYVGAQWGGDAERIFVVDKIPGAPTAEGRTIITNNEVQGFRKGDILISEKIFSDPSNVFETVGHEVGHQTMGASSNFSFNREHLMVYDMLKNSRYSEYWSKNVTDKLLENYNNHRAGWLGEGVPAILGDW